MAADTAGALTAGKAGVASTQRMRSLGELIAISIFWFALNFHWGALLQLLIPSQVIGLLLQAAPGQTFAARAAWVTSDRAALGQALVLGPGLIVALLANPFFGILSDRTTARFGRRRPYILIAGIINVLGLGLMAFVPQLFGSQGVGSVFAPGMVALMVTLVIVQFANNAAAAPFHALLPDMVPERQRGKASGIMGLAYWLGTISGFIVPFLLGFNSKALLSGTQSLNDYNGRLALGYLITAAVILVSAVLTCLFVHEIPLAKDAVSAEARRDSRRTSGVLVVTVFAVAAVVAVAAVIFRLPFGIQLDQNSLPVVELVALVVASYGAVRAFDFRPRRAPDFTWVLVTRMVVMIGVSIVQLFLLQYMLFVVKAANPQEASTIFLILLTITATLSTFFAGAASDRIGRKRMVYIAGTLMAIVGAAFVIAPYVLPGHILGLAYGAAAIFGLGFGAYVSVDWALVADVLPSEATFARDMGVWNIALTVPQVVATVVGSVLIGIGVALGSTTLGYTFLFVWFVIFCVLGTVTVRNIKGIAR